MSLCFKKKEKNVFGQMIEAPCIIIFCQHKRLQKLSSKVSQLWKKKEFQDHNFHNKKLFLLWFLFFNQRGGDTISVV